MDAILEKKTIQSDIENDLNDKNPNSEVGTVMCEKENNQGWSFNTRIIYLEKFN